MQIEAFVVICENDCLADANGVMPPELRNDAEWRFFQAGLDRAEVCVLGRKSHEQTPNVRERRRLVMSRRVERAQWEDERTVIWNPDRTSLALALSMFGAPVSALAITGGAGRIRSFPAKAGRIYAVSSQPVDECLFGRRDQTFFKAR